MHGILRADLTIRHLYANLYGCLLASAVKTASHFLAGWWQSALCLTSHVLLACIDAIPQRRLVSCAVTVQCSTLRKRGLLGVEDGAQAGPGLRRRVFRFWSPLRAPPVSCRSHNEATQARSARAVLEGFKMQVSGRVRCSNEFPKSTQQLRSRQPRLTLQQGSATDRTVSILTGATEAQKSALGWSASCPCLPDLQVSASLPLWMCFAEARLAATQRVAEGCVRHDNPAQYHQCQEVAQQTSQGFIMCICGRIA